MIPDINLLPSKERHRDKSSLLLFILLMVWVILLGIILFQYFITKSNVESLQTRVSSLEMEKVALETALQNEGPQITTENYAESVDFAEKLIVPTSKIIKELNKLLPETSFLTEYTYDDGEVIIQTEFDSLDRVAGYVTRLNKSAIFSDVKVDYIDTFRLADGEEEINTLFEEMPRYDVSFTLEIDMPELLTDTGGDDNE